MALCQANPLHIGHIFDIRRYLHCEGSLGGGQAAPTPGEFQDDQVDAQQPLVVFPCGIKGETGPRCKG